MELVVADPSVAVLIIIMMMEMMLMMMWMMMLLMISKAMVDHRLELVVADPAVAVLSMISHGCRTCTKRKKCTKVIFFISGH